MTVDDLMPHLKRADARAFEVLFNLYYEQAFETAYLVTRDRELARDATQETFIRVFQAIGSLRDARAFQRWLHVIATNAAVDVLRRRPPVTLVEDTAQLQPASLPVPPQGDPESEALASERRDAVRRAIAALDPVFRQVVILHYYHDLSVEEIAARLHCPPGTVKSRLHRARSAMARDLDSQFGPGSAAGLAGAPGAARGGVRADD